MDGMVGAIFKNVTINLNVTGGYYKMKKRKLNYIFHNPNTPEATADYLLKLFIEVNKPKVEAAIRKAALNAQKETKESYPVR